MVKLENAYEVGIALKPSYLTMVKTVSFAGFVLGYDFTNT